MEIDDSYANKYVVSELLKHININDINSNNALSIYLYLIIHAVILNINVDTTNPNITKIKNLYNELYTILYNIN